MPADYVQVLADIDEQITYHKRELDQLLTARPAIVAMRNKFNPVVNRPYAGMGAKGAIRELLTSELVFLSVAEITTLLLQRGWTTESSDPNRIVATTLSQMKAEGTVEKIHDTWRVKPLTGWESAADPAITSLGTAWENHGRQTSEP